MTLVEDFIIDVRVLAHDTDLAHPEFADEIVEAGVRNTIRSGRVSHGGYRLVAGGDGISPNVTNPNHYFLIAALTAKMFVGGRPDYFSSRTRPHSFSMGGRKNTMAELDEWITKANSGAMFNGWSNYMSWVEGMSGVPSTWLHLTRLRIQTGGFNTVTVNADGGAVSSP